ncbi:MAG: T9SS type A sorting domain-containing protein [Candidatus Kapabacteria bacterium]|nr:T9SS type A sorting domain-containing protein [Candidatus Kapabacteria bacterium]
MKKNKFKYLLLCLVSIALLFFYSKLNCQPSSLIFNDKTPSDTVDMGLTLNGVPVITTFNIFNTGTTDLRLWPTNIYSFAITPTNIPGHSEDHFEFDPVTAPDFLIKSGESRKFSIRYNSTQSPVFPAGKKYARARIGLAENLPLSDNDLAKGYRDFILIVRKTNKFIDGYEKFISFDSVYIHPVDTIRKIWKVQNNVKEDLNIENVIFNRILPRTNPHLFQSIIETPYTLTPENRTVDFIIRYYPIELGLDSAFTTIEFKPYPKTDPETKDSCFVSVSGVGVEQKLFILNAINASVKRDTIDIGNVRVKDNKDIELVFLNNGNIPFGAIKQEILEIGSEVRADGFTLTKKLSDVTHLQPSRTDTVKISFTPPERKNYLVRYIIESDISKRKIYGYPDSVKKIIFYIKGTGVEPFPIIQDTIDFGSIVMNRGDCPARRDTLLPIYNQGNLILEIKKLEIKPEFPNTPFRILTENINIPARSVDTLRIIFDALDSPPDDYQAILWIYSNSTKPLDTIKIILKAKGVKPDPINISLPMEIRAKPGSRIEIPILVEKDKVSLAKSYTDTLDYEHTLLKYIGYEKIGTASELVQFTNSFIKEDEKGGRLFIQLNDNKYLLPNDTLIKLRFTTFLGEKISTPINLLNPKFGDGICTNILTPQISRAFFSLDSVCGLEFKVGPRQSQFIFSLDDIYPNPTSEKIELKYNIAFETDVQFAIYNSFGELVYNHTITGHQSGEFSKLISTDNFSRGLYIFEMRAGIFRQTKNFLLIR